MKTAHMRIPKLVASLVISLGAVAQTVTGELPGAIESRTSPTATRGVLPLKVRTVLGLVVGRHKLDEVVAKLGPAEVIKADAIDARPNIVCFLSTKDDTLVLFEAGPLGGFETLTGVTVAPKSAYRADLSKCGMSDKVDRIATAAGPLGIGASISKFAATLGVTGKAARDGIVDLALEKKTTQRKKGSNQIIDVDITSGVVARASKDEILWFSIYYIESS